MREIKPPTEDLVHSTDVIAQDILKDIKLTLDCLTHNLKADGTIDRVNKQAKAYVTFGRCGGCTEQGTCHSITRQVSDILKKKLAIRTKNFQF